jgi:hypothetical protein
VLFRRFFGDASGWLLLLFLALLGGYAVSLGTLFLSVAQPGWPTALASLPASGWLLMSSRCATDVLFNGLIALGLSVTHPVGRNPSLPTPPKPKWPPTPRASHLFTAPRSTHPSSQASSPSPPPQLFVSLGTLLATPLNLAVQLALREAMPTATALLGVSAIGAGFAILMLDELRREARSRQWLRREAGRELRDEQIRRASAANSDVGVGGVG